MTINQCTFTHEWVLACCQYTLALVYCTQAICFCKQIVFLRVVTFDRKSYWQLVGCSNETVKWIMNTTIYWTDGMMMQFQINYTNFTGTILYTKASVETIIRLLSTPAFSASSFRVKKSFPYFCVHFCHRVIIEALIWYKKIAYFCRSESLNYIFIPFYNVVHCTRQRI